MNKNNRQKLILSAALLVAATASAFAQGNGIAGINEATSMVSSYFDPGTKLIYAIGAVVGLIGGNSILSNFLASFVGAFMYFATLTEVPIIQGLLASGMGEGPALALLLAGPSLSLPNMLVIRGVLGTKKTVVYVGLVIVMATISGYLFGMLF